MFGDNNKTRELASFLLEQYSLTDLLELNDVTEEELVCRLLEDGLLAEPRYIVQNYEEND